MIWWLLGRDREGNIKLFLLTVSMKYFHRRVQNCAHSEATPSGTCRSLELGCISWWVCVYDVIVRAVQSTVCPESRLYWRHTVQHERTLPETPQIVDAFDFLLTSGCSTFRNFIKDCWVFGKPHGYLTSCGCTTHTLKRLSHSATSFPHVLLREPALMVAGCPCTLYPCVAGLAGVVAAPGWCPVTWFPRGGWQACYSTRELECA